MFALLSDQGTPCPETALCERCYNDPEKSLSESQFADYYNQFADYYNNRSYASEQGSQADDIPDVLTFENCGYDTMLFCIICNENAYGEKLKN